MDRKVLNRAFKKFERERKRCVRQYKADDEHAAAASPPGKYGLPSDVMALITSGCDLI